MEKELKQIKNDTGFCNIEQNENDFTSYVPDGIEVFRILPAYQKLDDKQKSAVLITIEMWVKMERDNLEAE